MVRVSRYLQLSLAELLSHGKLDSSISERVGFIVRQLLIVLLGAVIPMLAHSEERPLVNAQVNHPSLMTDIRYAGNNNFIGRRVAGYRAPLCLLSEAASKALDQAQNLAERHNLSLLMYDCYRPQRAVDDFVTWVAGTSPEPTKAAYYPSLDRSSLIDLGYIASQSGHSRGSTVDLTLVDRQTGQPLDMGTPWDFFDPMSHTESDAIELTAKNNRLLLRQIMSAAGFRPYYAEWWHFTLIDEPFPDTYFDHVIE
jgi:D-alanyl-D-alanine dipeptidase